MAKRFRDIMDEPGYDSNKRSKYEEDEANGNDFVPIDFGNNKLKAKIQAKSGPEGINFHKAVPILDKDAPISQSGADKQDEQRFSIKDLQKMEEQQTREFEDWKKKEEIFEFKQTILRSKLRLENNRAKHIDNIAHLYLILDSHMPISSNFNSDDIKYPYKLLEECKFYNKATKSYSKLSFEDLKSLRKEVNFIVDLKHDSEIHEDYWTSIKTICDQKYTQMRQKEGNFNDDLDDDLPNITSTNPDCISKELDEMVAGKSLDELRELESEIEHQDFGSEAEYWYTCLMKIRYAKAKLTIEKLYNDFYSKHKEEIEKVVSEYKTQEENKQEIETKPDVQEDLTNMINDNLLKEMGIPEEELQKLQEGAQRKEKQADNSKFPKSLRFDLNDTFSFDNFDHESIQLFKDEQMKGFADDENEFDQDVIFFKNKYDWAHKYRPRKPRFFNRVKTGYEWNAYNRRHYDADNPPPTIVQGYKFNIFYPDLINKHETPQYYLQNCEDPDKLRIIFKSGPPYEDIAFEIVNREWDLNEKNGFKSVFDRGILHLYFNFKRHRYTT